MIAVASFTAKCRCRVAYRTSVEYSTAKPRVEKSWMKKRAPVPSGIFSSLLFRGDTVLGPGAVTGRFSHRAGHFETIVMAPEASSAGAPAPWNRGPTDESPRSSRAKYAVR